jgi:hypothetical protein
VACLRLRKHVLAPIIVGGRHAYEDVSMPPDNRCQPILPSLPNYCPHALVSPFGNPPLVILSKALFSYDRDVFSASYTS